MFPIASLFHVMYSTRPLPNAEVSELRFTACYTPFYLRFQDLDQIPRHAPKQLSEQTEIVKPTSLLLNLILVGPNINISCHQQPSYCHSKNDHKFLHVNEAHSAQRHARVTTGRKSLLPALPDRPQPNSTFYGQMLRKKAKY